MLRRLKQLIRGEKGQTLPIVLSLLAIGGLTIAVSLNYATTSLKGSQIVDERTRGIYAAGAGVEHSIWSLVRGEEPPTQLPENINGMAVGMEKLDLGTFTLYCGELEAPGAKSNQLNVSSTITWVEDNRYEFEITVTLLVAQTVHLETTGARIPLNYHYEDGSAIRSDGEDTCPDDPEITCPAVTQDDQGADLLNWLWKDWGLTRPELDKDNTEFTLSFLINGTGSVAGQYAWVLADPDVIGIVGEITGTRYRITSTATRPDDGRTTAEIVSDVMIRDDGTTHITSWRISK